MDKKESCLIIAGEKSGEDHAMTFLPGLIKLKPDCHFYGVGGDHLKKQGVEIFYDLKEFSGIGITEVIAKIPFYFKAMDSLVEEVKKRETKTAILVDFQGFNLKLSKKLKKMGVNVLYYVAPQAWVWKPWRAKVLEKNVHTLFTILPFEKEWFQRRGVSKVRGVMHPLMLSYKDSLKSVKCKEYKAFTDREPRILLLPGSRNVEVEKLLSVFVNATSILKGEGIQLELGIVKTETVSVENYGVAKEITNTWHADNLKEALEWADMCIAASGTVTLATGLFGVPTVVCYKISLMTEFILGIFLNYKGPISLTNIVHQEYLYPELIQHESDKYNIAKNLRTWIKDEKSYDKIAGKLIRTQEKLSGEKFDIAKYMSDVIEENGC